MNCIIIEDEIPAQRILKSYLNKLPNIEVFGVFNACIQANSFLRQNEVDVVFLDINLPDISGIDFIKTIKNPPAVIMTTAYPNYAADSFELETIVDYLVKPFSFERFLKAINKTKDRLEKPRDNGNGLNIFLNVDKTLHKINLDDILYLESDRNYITLVTTKQKLCYIESLKNWKEKLPIPQFLQVHKSYIINTTYVDKISGKEVFVNGIKLPIGRTFKQELLKELKIT